MTYDIGSMRTEITRNNDSIRQLQKQIDEMINQKLSISVNILEFVNNGKDPEDLQTQITNLDNNIDVFTTEINVIGTSNEKLEGYIEQINKVNDDVIV